MKREIICNECNSRRLKNLGSPIVRAESGELATQHPIGPEERHRSVYGLARGSYQCDQCGSGINEGIECVAITYWIRDITPPPWEQHYIRPLMETA